jgi:hypothetical protein
MGAVTFESGTTSARGVIVPETATPGTPLGTPDPPKVLASAPKSLVPVAALTLAE